MMSAKEMFEKLGFKQITDNDTVCVYRKEEETLKTSALFFKKDKRYCLKCSTDQFSYYAYSVMVDEQLHRAICRQLEENK